MSKDSLELLTSRLMGIRERKAGLKFKLDGISQEEKNVENELIQTMDNRDIKSFKHKKFGTITSASRIWAKIVDFAAALKFFEERGLDKQVFQLKPQNKRLNQFVREALDKGETLPVCLDFSPTAYISVRKG